MIDKSIDIFTCDITVDILLLTHLVRPCYTIKLTCNEYYKGIFIFNLTVLARFILLYYDYKYSGIDVYTIQSFVQSTNLQHRIFENKNHSCY